MFAVIENKQNNKSIIGVIDKSFDFIEFVKKEINDDNYIYLADVPLNKILNEKIFKNNKYLINYTTKILYIEKAINIDRGILYNTYNIDINILCQWKLIENKIKLPYDDYL